MIRFLSSRPFLMIVFLFLNYCTTDAQHSPTFNGGQDPKPKAKKWVLVEQLSDEFEGDTLDESKWKNTNPKGWKGRAPGIFKKDVVSVADGQLRLTVYDFLNQKRSTVKPGPTQVDSLDQNTPLRWGIFSKQK